MSDPFDLCDLIGTEWTTRTSTSPCRAFVRESGSERPASGSDTVCCMFLHLVAWCGARRWDSFSFFLLLQRASQRTTWKVTTTGWMIIVLPRGFVKTARPVPKKLKGFETPRPLHMRHRSIQRVQERLGTEVHDL